VNVHQYLRPDSGQLHVTHKTIEPFSWWEITQLAEECGLFLYCSIVFDRCLYPGYVNRKVLDKKSFPLHDARTFVFMTDPKFSISSGYTLDPTEAMDQKNLGPHITDSTDESGGSTNNSTEVGLCADTTKDNISANSTISTANTIASTIASSTTSSNPNPKSFDKFVVSVNLKHNPNPNDNELVSLQATNIKEKLLVSLRVIANPNSKPNSDPNSNCNPNLNPNFNYKPNCSSNLKSNPKSSSNFPPNSNPNPDSKAKVVYDINRSGNRLGQGSKKRHRKVL
jgi:hypothetical protein